MAASCLVQNTSLLESLRDLVELTAYERLATNKGAGISEIYNDIRKAGVEIDLQSIGYLYNDVLPKTYEQFQSDAEVDDFVTKNYKDAIRRAALLEDTDNGKQQIGQDKPEMHIVNGLLNMFTSQNTEDVTEKSDWLQMQNALWKGIQRKLSLPESQKPKNETQWRDVLQKALDYEKLGITDVNGKLNSIADLYEAMRNQLEDATKKLENEGDFATAEKWREMTKELEASTYSLLFSRGEAKQLLDGIMKDAGFEKQLKNGKTILDWNKLAGNIGSIQDLRQNVERVLEDAGFTSNVIEGVKNSLENEFNDLHAALLDRKLKDLESRENKIGAQKSNKKADLRRLAELNNLGIFEGAHDKLLNHVLGVTELQAQDIEDLKQLSQAASNLFKDIEANFGSDIYASRHLQTIQHSINNIIARNINDTTRLNRIVNGIKKFFDVFLTGLLLRPFTLFENIVSGTKEIAAPLVSAAFMGNTSKLTKEDFEVYRKMLADVSLRGISFGEEIGSFAPRENYVNMLKWDFGRKDTIGKSLKAKGESLLYALTLPGRIGLLGFDSANKVIITNKTFNNAIFKALTQKGMSEENAKNFMNEALYGKSFEQAKTDAKELIEKINKDLPDKYKVPVNSRTITTFANDLVKANLNSNGTINNDVIEAAYKAAYHVAGYGLGHEPNNMLSSQIKGFRDRRRREEQRLAKEKKYDELANHRLKDTLLNGMVIRFTGGATNWVVLRAQSGLGLGLLFGTYNGKFKSDIDFKDEKTIRQSIRDREVRRNMIARSLVGISYTVLSYGLGYALWGGGADKDKKKKLDELQAKRISYAKQRAESGMATQKAKKLQVMDKEITDLQKSMSMYKTIKGGYMGNRLFKKLAPDLMLINYYLDTDPNYVVGALNYAQTAMNIGNESSATAKILSAMELAKRNDTEAAQGQLWSILGDRLGVPIWNAGKDWKKLVTWPFAKVESDYKRPTNWAEGLFGGGMAEDLGIFKRNPSLTTLPGIGAQGYELFKQKGLGRVNDLKNQKEWWNMKYTNDDGNSEYIIRTATDRLKAKDAFEKYQQQN